MPDPAPTCRNLSPVSSIDPADLEICLRVLEEVGGLPADDPDSVTVQRSVGRMFGELRLRHNVFSFVDIMKRLI